MNVVLINPHLVALKKDPFTTGIVYMPIGLAYLASALRQNQIKVNVIDVYGANPQRVEERGDFFVYGQAIDEAVKQIQADTHVVFVYAINLLSHLSTIEIIQTLKKKRPDLPVVVVENTQAVTAYSLRQVADDFYRAGAEYILTGETEDKSVQFLSALEKSDMSLLKSIDGLGSKDFYNPPQRFIDDLDRLPRPAWDLFPLANYWQLQFAHGPFTSKKYLPLLTSRGCPYPCRFCVVPETNQQRWRSRSALNVVDEIESLMKTFGVYEFHLEDLNPTVSDERIRSFCQEIIRRELKISWKIVAGTKVETIKNEETIDLMAQAGCKYISISPETGSQRILKMMQKPFNLNHAIKLVHHMSKRKIASQACFVLGFPGETKEDLELTYQLVKKLTLEGVDEIALFIATPVPGSSIFKDFSGYKNFSELNFSPSWRTDFKELQAFRLKAYATFLLLKSVRYPFRILGQIKNFLLRRFETKMEMVPYRALRLRLWGLRAKSA